MAVRYIDGFDDYAVADLTAGNWTYLGSSAHTIIAGRNGSCLNMTSIRFAGKTIDSQASWVVGCAFKIVASPTSSGAIVGFLDGGIYQAMLSLFPDGTLQIMRSTTGTSAGTAVTGGASVLALSVGIWYYIEVKITIADSIGAGTCVVKVNGVTWITVTTGQDLKYTANATANTIELICPPAGTVNFDDVYILDGTAGAVAGDNDFLGDVRVESLFPTGTGTTDDWTTDDASADNWEHVNEAAPNATDYVTSVTPNQIDTYAMGNLASNASKVWAVQTGLVIRKMDAGARTVAPVLRGADGDKVGTTVAVLDGYYSLQQVYEQNPLTSPADWTQATVEGIEFGIKLIA